MTDVKRFRVNRNNLSPSKDGNVVMASDYAEMKLNFDEDLEMHKMVIAKLDLDLLNATKERDDLLNESVSQLARRLVSKILDRLFPDHMNPSTICFTCGKEGVKTQMLNLGFGRYACNVDDCVSEYLQNEAW